MPCNESRRAADRSETVKFRQFRLQKWNQHTELTPNIFEKCIYKHIQNAADKSAAVFAQFYALELATAHKIHPNIFQENCSYRYLQNLVDSILSFRTGISALNLPKHISRELYL